MTSSAVFLKRSSFWASNRPSASPHAPLFYHITPALVLVFMHSLCSLAGMGVLLCYLLTEKKSSPRLRPSIYPITNTSLFIHITPRLRILHFAVFAGLVPECVVVPVLDDLSFVLHHDFIAEQKPMQVLNASL
jgi:hypothetical protein